MEFNVPFQHKYGYGISETTTHSQWTPCCCLDYCTAVYNLVVVLALEILHEESSQLRLEINWTKTKIQVFDEDMSQPSKVSVLGHDVEVVDSFVYLGSCIDIAGGSETDICRRIEITRTCMKALDRNIWRSSISLQTKIRLYNVYILPILLYGADTWSMTSTSSRQIDAYDQWCLRHILRIPYTAHVTNDDVRRRTCQPPATFYHDKTAASVRTHCPCWSISRPLAGSTSSYQSSAGGLAMPAWSTKMNLASND